MNATLRANPSNRAAGSRSDLSASPVEVERAEYRFYVDQLREGMTVFDVGANIGELTMLFSKFVGPSGQVHAFEAGRQNFEKLEQVRGLVGRMNILAKHSAVADRPGPLILKVYSEPYSTWNTLANRPLRDYGVAVDPAGEEAVEGITIDEYCRGCGIAAVDLLKIDVEGAEYQVLIGSREMLERRAVRWCLFEFGQTTFDMGNRPERIATFLDECGYELTNLVSGDPVFPGGSSVATARFAMHLATPRP